MTPDGLSDEQLVKGAQGGDRAAFDQLVERHLTTATRVANRLADNREAAADAVQEALLRAWQRIDAFEGRARFSTWLVRIVVNEVYRAGERSTPELPEPPDLVGERVPTWGTRPDEQFETREFLDAVARALDELPLDYRTSVVLRDVEGLSTAEAAEVLGIGERAMKSRLHRGRMALRAKLDGYFEEGYLS